MQSKGHGVTDIGRRRVANEDAFLVDDALGLYVVADGMGGHHAGEIASSEAVDALHGMVRDDESQIAPVELLDAELPLHPDTPAELQAAMRVMERAVQAATYMVYGISQSNPEHQGMGTTLSALLLRGHYAVTAQVGDSRIYRIRGWEVTQLTEDHTLVEWQLKKGLITAEEAKFSRQRNVITRAVGSKEYVQVDRRLLCVQPGDGFLLCSDGLHSYLQPGELPGLLSQGMAKAAQRAVELANERGGKDNITAVVVTVD